MRKQFCWHILAIILLCICLPFGILCDKNDQRNDRTIASSTERKIRMPNRGIPLRDDSDYVRENEQQFATDDDDDYDDDEYYDGDEQDTNVKHKNKNENVDDDDDETEQQSPEIVEQAQSVRTQIIQRPKELTETELAAILQAAQPTQNVDAQAPTVSAEMCPKECSCLNDFMTCTRPHLKHLPKVPQFIQSLYVFLYIYILISHSLFFLYLIASQLFLVFLFVLSLLFATFIRYFVMFRFFRFTFMPYFQSISSNISLP